jgi:hypothetical protein
MPSSSTFTFPARPATAVCRELRLELGDALAILFLSGERVESFDRVAGLLLGATTTSASRSRPMSSSHAWKLC